MNNYVFVYVIFNCLYHHKPDLSFTIYSWVETKIRLIWQLHCHHVLSLKGVLSEREQQKLTSYLERSHCRDAQNLQFVYCIYQR